MNDVMSTVPWSPKVVERATFQAQLDALCVREKAHTREGDAIAAARRRLPHGRGGWCDPDHWRTRAGDTVGCVRGPPAAHRLLFHVVPRPPGTGAVRRVHLLHDAGSRAVRPARPRRHLRHVLPGSVRGEPPLPRLHGLGHALVLGPGLARHAPGRTPDRHDAPRLLPAAGRRCLRDLLDVDARRRGHGQQLPAARPDRVRAAGAVGGLARRLAAAGGRSTTDANRWTPHLPMGAAEGRAFGRSRDRRRGERCAIH